MLPIIINRHSLHIFSHTLLFYMLRQLLSCNRYVFPYLLAHLITSINVPEREKEFKNSQNADYAYIFKIFFLRQSVLRHEIENCF